MQSKSCEKKIVLVETGGTISTDFSDGYLSAGKVSLAERFPSVPFIRSVSPVTVLSENETFGDINAICKRIAEEANKGDCDGIIATHGTDSLTYFAAASALILSGIKIPVVIVSADLPLSDEKSNGADNMLGAYEFIRSAKDGGVFAAYKNDGECVKLHYGARLNYSRGFDGYVSSAANGIRGEVRGGKFVSLCDKIERDTSWDNCGFVLPNETENKTRLVIPYVGLDYIALNRAAKADGAEIAHDSFHSGTLKTSGENSVNALEVPVFSAGRGDGNSYESEKFLSKNIRVYKNIAPVALYFKLVLSQGLDAEKRENYLRANVCGEYF